MADFSLRLYAPVLVAAGVFVDEVTDPSRATWRRSVRATGGPWLGTFRLYDEEAVLRTWFNEYLGYEIEERYGAPTWRGLIWEMDYTHLGITRRRSLAGVKNAVKGIYTDTTDTVQETTWATKTSSISRFGRMEEILVMDGYLAATVEGRRDKVLAERAWPNAQPTGGRGARTTYLDVSVAGYAFTANNKYVTDADGLTGDADEWVTAIVGTDLEFLAAGRIQANTFQVKRTLNVPQRAWETLTEIASLGDSSLVPWKIYADLNRLVHYEQVDKTPRYFLHGGKLYDATSLKTEVAPWLLEAGVVVRDMEYPVGTAEAGSWLDDNRDIYLEELTVTGDGGLSWSTEDFSETELLAAQEDYLRSLGGSGTFQTGFGDTGGGPQK